MSAGNDMSPGEASRIAEQKAKLDSQPTPGDEGRENQHLKVPSKTIVGNLPDEEADQVKEMEGPPSRERSKSRRQARSGSITETTLEVGGMKKVVLEMGSSSDDEGDEGGGDGSPKKKASGGSKKGSGSSKDGKGS